MKILQICSARSIGGGERYLADLSNSLVGRGHDVFVALAPEAPLKDELTAIPKDNILFSRMRNALDIFSAFELADFVRRNDIDIIHVHLARDYPLAAFVARLTKKPFVLTRHVLFPLKRIQKLILKNVGGVIAPSNAIADSLEKQNLFSPEKITIIRYGINLEHFSQAEKTHNETFVVGTIGHLAPIKGHDVVFYPKEMLQEALGETGGKALSYINPSTHGLDGIRGVLIEGKTFAEVETQFVTLLVFLGLLLPFSLWIFGRAIKRAKREGSLIQY
jgi:glycosyltransferase involved in cell wall biosynthesis